MYGFIYNKCFVFFSEYKLNKIKKKNEPSLDPYWCSMLLSVIRENILGHWKKTRMHGDNNNIN